jgi:hypothetical protein
VKNRSLTHDGITFHSLLEIEHWKKLKKMSKKRALKVEYENDKLPYTVVSHHNYHCDITITFPDGHKRFIEIKGYLRPKDRTKLKCVKDQHQGIDLRIVFAKDNKLNAKSKTRYSTWAKKLGLPYSVGKIPNEWLNRNG